MDDYITPIDQWIIDDPFAIVLIIILAIWAAITLYLWIMNEQRKEEVRQLKIELWKERRKPNNY